MHVLNQPVITSGYTVQKKSTSFKGRFDKMLNSSRTAHISSFLNTHSNRLSKAGAAVLNTLVKVVSFAQYLKIKALNSLKHFSATKNVAKGPKKFIDFSFNMSQKLNKAAYQSKKKLNSVAYKSGLTNSFVNFKLNSFLKKKPPGKV